MATKLFPAQAGVTLVELLVASTIGLVVGGVILTTVSVAGRSTRQATLTQQMEQESALISELFSRTVRNGNFVCVGTGTTPPDADTNNVSVITVRNAAGAAIAKFDISGDSLELNDSKYLTGYLCAFRTPASHFKVFQNGRHVEFYLSMYKAMAGDTLYYAQTVGDVRCKN